MVIVTLIMSYITHQILILYLKHKHVSDDIFLKCHKLKTSFFELPFQIRLRSELKEYNVHVQALFCIHSQLSSNKCVCHLNAESTWK